MAKRKPKKAKVPIWLYAIIGLQILCAGFFVSEFVTEVFGLRHWALPFAWREALQILASVGLILGVVTSGVLLQNSSRSLTKARLELQVASGEFLRAMYAEFERWGLSQSESDVALFAMRGYSNSEIAKLRGTSEATIKTQLNSVFRKAGVSGRHQLMSHFVEELIAEVPEIRK